MSDDKTQDLSNALAIVGMSGRFPGASTVERVLAQSVEWR